MLRLLHGLLLLHTITENVRRSPFIHSFAARHKRLQFFVLQA